MDGVNQSQSPMELLLKHSTMRGIEMTLAMQIIVHHVSPLVHQVPWWRIRCHDAVSGVIKWHTLPLSGTSCTRHFYWYTSLFLDALFQRVSSYSKIDIMPKSAIISKSTIISKRVFISKNVIIFKEFHHIKMLYWIFKSSNSHFRSSIPKWYLTISIQT